MKPKPDFFCRSRLKCTDSRQFPKNNICWKLIFKNNNGKVATIFVILVKLKFLYTQNQSRKPEPTAWTGAGQDWTLKIHNKFYTSVGFRITNLKIRLRKPYCILPAISYCHGPVLWIELHWIWIRIQNCGSIWIRIQVRILIQGYRYLCYQFWKIFINIFREKKFL